MATENNNLSEIDLSTVPDASPYSFAIVASEWNNQITDNLLKGAHDTLLRAGAWESRIEVYRVPGAYELPSAAQMILEKRKVDAVICIGSVIRGETSHFDYVCEAVAQGVKDVGLKYNKPVIFGVLTDDHLQQSIDRSGGKHGNKGDEAGVTAIKMAHLQANL